MYEFAPDMQSIVTKYEFGPRQIRPSWSLYDGAIDIFKRMACNVDIRRCQEAGGDNNICLACLTYWSNEHNSYFDHQLVVSGSSFTKADTALVVAKEMMEESGLVPITMDALKCVTIVKDEKDRLITSYMINISLCEPYIAGSMDSFLRVLNPSDETKQEKVQVVIYGTRRDMCRILPTITCRYPSKDTDVRRTAYIKALTVVSFSDIADHYNK